MFYKNIVDELMKNPNVEAICLGGSRASGLNDEKSDYDVYVYYNNQFPLEIRGNILKPNCKHMKIGVRYFTRKVSWKGSQYICYVASKIAAYSVYTGLVKFQL